MDFSTIKIEDNKIFIYQLIPKDLEKSLQKENIKLKIDDKNISYIDYDRSSLIKLQNLLSNSKDELIESFLYKNRTIPYL